MAEQKTAPERRQPATPQDVALELANIIDGLCAARDNVPLRFPPGEDFGDTDVWKGIWMALDGANDAGMVLLAREGYLRGTEVRHEGGGLVGTVLDADDVGVEFLDDGVARYMLLPPEPGPYTTARGSADHDEKRFPGEWYFARAGSDEYDWEATAELLRDFASQPAKVAA